MTKKKLEEKMADLRKRIKEIEDDGSEQRKLIQKLTGLIKAWKFIIPEKFCIKAFDIINEYERRFTLIDDKLKLEHPVFTYKEGQNILLSEREEE